MLLVLRVPNTLPWRLSEASSMLYGWVFLGLALYYLFAVVNGQWGQALGPRNPASRGWFRSVRPNALFLYSAPP